MRDEETRRRGENITAQVLQKHQGLADGLERSLRETVGAGHLDKVNRSGDTTILRLSRGCCLLTIDGVRLRAQAVG